MDCYVGIDLGSTTTKAIFMDTEERILGRGITNSRSNYGLACEIASDEAAINARFALLRARIAEGPRARSVMADLMGWLESKFHLAHHLEQVKALEEVSAGIVGRWPDEGERAIYREALATIFARMREAAAPLFRPDAPVRSDFFRDIASSQYLEYTEQLTREPDDARLTFDRLTAVYDRAILLVEARNYSSNYADYLEFACREVIDVEGFRDARDDITAAAEYAAGVEFNALNTIGTGYGRQTLPFPKHQIRSEILCHGLGAHAMFPDTRTVLDIGGQDTKAIQVDGRGIVTSFQMNDRCAAGCGRYLGYIADEMNMGVHELGPLAMQANRTIRINSTCTVFAGAELRERLAIGERREDILSGLHRAIVLRAMSLLARSGGIESEFTFTGGVAKNEAATSALKRLVHENYGEMTINISPDSIYTGALGAALFARRDRRGDMVNVDLNKLKKRVN
ncbi:MAG: acyl-CoA dehydratase activase [Candidatus Krumholzibacteria bacterium]|nr:acyl-CoA dehydratase activase [Candidatus Krumholzibacteria bacterium]